MPHDEKAELSLLGHILLDPAKFSRINGLIKHTDYFYHKQNRMIYEQMQEMDAEGQVINLVSLKDALTKSQILKEVGGEDKLKMIAEQTIISSDIESLCHVLYEKYMLRQLIDIGQKMYDQGFSEMDARTILEESEKHIFELSQSNLPTGFEPFDDIFYNVITEISQMMKNPDAMIGISSGFSYLDSMTMGFKPGEMVLIAARPSMGKTAFALNICQHVAKTEAKKVALFSLEMASEQLMYRIISRQTMLHLGKIMTGQITQTDLKTITDSGKLFHDSIYFEDVSNITVAEMRSMCRNLKNSKGLDMIMIDYIQLMSGGVRMESRQQEIAYISRSLKALAKEMEVPVIALSQLSRKPDERHDKRPLLSDLRDSGAIEQDADIVMFIHRDEYYSKENVEDELKNVAEVIVAKNRNGRIGTVKLHWDGSTQLFCGLANESETY